VHGSEDDVLVDTEITGGVVTLTKSAALVGDGVGGFVHAGKLESSVVVGLHAATAEGSEEVRGGFEVSIDGGSVQIGASVVEAEEHAVGIGSSEALDGEDTSLVVGVRGLQEGIVGLGDCDLVVGEDVGKVEDQGVLAQVVRDHLGEGNEEVVAAQVVGIGSNSALMEGEVSFILEVRSSKEAVGDDTLVGGMIGERARSFQMHKGETGLTPSRMEDVIAGSINASPGTTSALRSLVTIIVVVVVVVVASTEGDTENTSEEEEQLEVVGHYIFAE